MYAILEWTYTASLHDDEAVFDSFFLETFEVANQYFEERFLCPVEKKLKLIKIEFDRFGDVKQTVIKEARKHGRL